MPEDSAEQHAKPINRFHRDGLDHLQVAKPEKDSQAFKFVVKKLKSQAPDLQAVVSFRPVTINRNIIGSLGNGSAFKLKLLLLLT